MVLEAAIVPTCWPSGPTRSTAAVAIGRESPATVSRPDESMIETYAIPGRFA